MTITRYAIASSAKKAYCLFVVLCEKSELEILREKLSQQNKVLVDVAPDGNCLYASIAYHCNSNAYAVRQKISQFIGDHQSEFRPKDDSGVDLMSGGLADYLKHMSVDGTWGDGVTLSTAARLYQRPIHVFTLDSDKPYEISLPHGLNYMKSQWNSATLHTHVVQPETITSIFTANSTSF